MKRGVDKCRGPAHVPCQVVAGNHPFEIDPVCHMPPARHGGKTSGVGTITEQEEPFPDADSAQGTERQRQILENLVEECVEQVMERIREQHER